MPRVRSQSDSIDIEGRYFSPTPNSVSEWKLPLTAISDFSMMQLVPSKVCIPGGWEKSGVFQTLLVSG
jgi:hypothetical protein